MPYKGNLGLPGRGPISWEEMGAGDVAGFLLTPLERQGTLACPAGAPFLGKKWGKEPPGEEVPPPGPPSLVGLCGGGCTSHLLPGLRPSH